MRSLTERDAPKKITSRATRAESLLVIMPRIRDRRLHPDAANPQPVIRAAQGAKGAHFWKLIRLYLATLQSSG